MNRTRLTRAVSRPMRTALTLAALLLLPTFAAAQVAPETSGLMLNAHLNGNAISAENADEIENGGGLGLKAGWGFSPNWMVYGALDGASISSTPDYSLGHFDLGVRYSFTRESAWVPFVAAGINGRAAVWENFEAGNDLEISGGGLSLGGGISHFFSPAWAFEAALQWSFGEFSNVKLGNQSAALDDYAFSATSTRLDLGLSWHARGR